MLSLPLRAWRTLYAIGLCAAYPWARVRPYLRARREPEYAERTSERFGHVPAGIPADVLWFHSVSAGEAISAAPLISRLATQFPARQFLVTATTPAGSAQLCRLLADKYDNVSHCYAPLDFPHAVRRFFARVRPRLLVLLETELWPNLLREAHAAGVPALLVNGRLSERSASGYQRIGPLTLEMLEHLTFIACQYPLHAERFMKLGARPDQVGALGSIKFDVELPADHAGRLAELEQHLGSADRRIWIAGSTHPGEEKTLLAAHRQLKARYPDLLLVLVPRHPPRAEAVAAMLRDDALTVVRYSAADEGAVADVLLVDVMGELAYLYGLADVAFLGGSLVSVGGHNPIEAAICGKPLLMGPETFNFPDVVAAFVDAGCLTLVRTPADLVAAVTRLLDDPEAARREGAAARQVVLDNRGALARLENLLAAQIRSVGGSVPE